jgi:hypothetical protein
MKLIHWMVNITSIHVWYICKTWGRNAIKVKISTLKTGKHYIFIVVVNHCQGGSCIFCKKINILHHLDIPCLVWNQTPKLWGWMPLDKARAWLHPNVSNDNFPQQIFTVKRHIWWWCAPKLLDRLKCELVKTTKVRSWGTFPSSQHFGGRGLCRNYGMRLGRMTSNQSFTWTCTNQTTSWLVHRWNIFGVKMNHKQIRTHKTHHGPNLEETTIFPLIVYFALNHGNNIQMSICFGIPKWESQNFHNWNFRSFGGP